MRVNITFPHQFLSAQHIHVDTVIANAILKKGTRGSFHQWPKDDYDLAVTVIQKPHAQGGFGITPNVLAQTSAKVAMASRFLQLVGSLSLEEQKLWFPNQVVHDPDTCTTAHLLHLKSEYDVLVNSTDTLHRKCTRYKTWRFSLPPLSLSYYRLSIVFTRLMCKIRSHLNRESLVQSCHRLNVSCLGR